MQIAIARPVATISPPPHATDGGVSRPTTSPRWPPLPRTSTRKVNTQLGPATTLKDDRLPTPSSRSCLRSSPSSLASPSHFGLLLLAAGPLPPGAARALLKTVYSIRRRLVIDPSTNDVSATLLML
uniref:Uncharacterized protein n=1 Tax=Steinernema glaseri TaxID=37863 RepID=A0A1I7YT47_9BILA